MKPIHAHTRSSQIRMSVLTTSFDINDLGQADNQPIEQTYSVIPWKNTNWIDYIPMHAHVFLMSASKSGLERPDDHVQGPQVETFYAFTPSQLNYVMSQDVDVNTGIEAMTKYKYVGINMTPPPPGYQTMKFSKTTPRHLVIHIRSTHVIENWWPDSRSCDHVGFAFKTISTFYPNLKYKCTETDTRAYEGTRDKIVQVVGIRGRYRHPDREAITTCVNGVYDVKNTYMPVGIVFFNPYSLQMRDDKKYAKEGFLCNDGLTASQQHIKAMTLAI